MIVCGWADGYRNNTFRTVPHLDVPWRLLAGPWSHADPATSRPGPAIDATVEMVRFFDEHLPRRAAVRRARRRRCSCAGRCVRKPIWRRTPGVWRDADTWPPPGWAERVITPVLDAGDDGIEELVVVGDVGVAAWNSCAGSLPWGQPTDQRGDDARSLTYDWLLAAQADLVGNPSVSLRVRASAPVAHLGVKLCDVFPDGTSALITRGMLNLTHRGSWPADADGEAGRRPAPVVPGEWMDVTVAFEATTWTLSPATGCGWPSPAPTGRTAGPRRHRCGWVSTGAAWR